MILFKLMNNLLNIILIIFSGLILLFPIENNLSSSDQKLLVSNVNKKLIPYVQNFINKADQHHVEVRNILRNITIGFADLSDLDRWQENGQPYHMHGYCFYSQNYIGIDPVYWSKNSLSEIEKQQLLLHELGHCVLGRLHDSREVWESKSKSYTAKSHMKSGLLSQDIVLSHLIELEDELFDPSRFNEVAVDEMKDPDTSRVTFEDHGN